MNACRVCVVEVEGSRVLVPSCARKAESGMRVKTDSERVRLSRRMVLEFLGSSVDVSLTGSEVAPVERDYDADPSRYGPEAAPAAAGERDARHAGHHHGPTGQTAETVAQPVKVDNDLYVRDYSRCILCYKCVEACGVDAQNTFAIAVAGRGLRRAHLDRVRRGAARLRLRLLRQLHRRLPDRRPDVQAASTTCARPATGTRRSRP